jgi:hypothetical protein
MKTKRIVMFGFAALVTAAMFTLAGCKNPAGGDGGGAKTLKITGLIGVSVSGDINVRVCNINTYNAQYEPGANAVAHGTGSLSNNEAVFQLKRVEGNRDEGWTLTNENWTGSGSYYVMVQLNKRETPYVTTSKYDFSSNEITVPWNLFILLPDYSRMRRN